MDYIYEKKSGSPQTFIELYGKDKLFELMNKECIEIRWPYIGEWFLTKKGVEEIIKYNPEKYKNKIFVKVSALVGVMISKQKSSYTKDHLKIDTEERKNKIRLRQKSL